MSQPRYVGSSAATSSSPSTVRTATASTPEASGSITLDAVRAAAKTGGDAMSVGATSHSAPASDLVDREAFVSVSGTFPR
jgi:nicotinate-nucleotide pyrophosphorylase